MGKTTNPNTNKHDIMDNRKIWDSFKVNDSYSNFEIIANLLKLENEILYYNIKKEIDPTLYNMKLEIQKSEKN